MFKRVGRPRLTGLGRPRLTGIGRHRRTGLGRHRLAGLRRHRLAIAAMSLGIAPVGLLNPAGGYKGPYPRGPAASFRVGAAVESFSPLLRGQASGHDPADCTGSAAFTGTRQFEFEEPYLDSRHSGHYDPGDPFLDCNHNSRWDGNLLGGGASTPRYYDRIADQVTARAMVVSASGRTLAVEVVDQEGLFDVYQQQIRAKVAADGYRLNGIFISATHDESAPDSLGLGGVTPTTSGVNDYWVRYMVTRSARAIEQAYRAMRPASIRYTEVLEPSNLRQCWSSYPFVDDQHVPVLQAVSSNGKTIVTLASVSQHDETLGFNGGNPELNRERRWVSADWVHFFRNALERQLGGVGIEMAGSVGSVESPEVYGQWLSRTPQRYIDASHPAGCRTLFEVAGRADVAGKQHVPLGYLGETRAFGDDMAKPVVRALRSGAFHESASSQLWGARANICIPLQNTLFTAAATAGVFAHRPGYNRTCTVASPVLPNGSTSGQAIRSQVAAFRIGDGEFLSIPGEAFPFTYLRGFLGPKDMPHPGDPLPPWLIPHLHTPFRFVDGLAEDMIGYIFPSGDAAAIPSASNPNPSGTDRFGCAHSDDAESTSAQAGDIIGSALVRLLDAHGTKPEKVVRGRYVLPGGALSRDPLGGPEIKCAVDRRFHPRGPANAVELADGRVVHPQVWMSLSGLPQQAPDRDTRGYFDSSGRRVWLDVFPAGK